MEVFLILSGDSTLSDIHGLSLQAFQTGCSSDPQLSIVLFWTQSGMGSFIPLAMDHPATYTIGGYASPARIFYEQINEYGVTNKLFSAIIKCVKTKNRIIPSK